MENLLLFTAIGSSFPLALIAARFSLGMILRVMESEGK